VIFDELFRYARRGLAVAGVSDDDIEQYLAPIKARREAQTTPSDWKKRRVRELLSGGADLPTAIAEMQREYVDRSIETDSFAEWV
jgi:hypothetical protein